MIMFRKIRYKNLLSTGNYFTEIRFDKSQNTLIVGNNGAGKSTMLDALCFVLFGKPFRAITKPIMVNSINGKECVVEVEFDTNNKSYKIVRGIKPNIFEIYCNGVIINQDASVKDYQEHLEKFILKLNFKSFTQIVILGSASFIPFMQLSTSDRRAIIEDLLDIQIYSTMNSLLKERVTTNKDNLNIVKNQIDLTNQKYALQQSHIKTLKLNNDTWVSNHKNQILENEQSINEITNEIDNLQNSVKEMQESISDKAQIESRIQKLNQFETKIKTNIGIYKKDIQFYSNNDSCPTCRQNINQEFKTTELDNLTNKIRDCNTGLEDLVKKLDDEKLKQKEIQKVLSNIQSVQTLIATKNTSINEKNRQNIKLNTELSNLNNDMRKLDVEEEQLETLKSNLLKLEAEKHELLEEKTYYETSGILLKDNGIKTQIVKQYLPVINKLVNKYLQTLDFFVNFNLDESFKESIKSRHRDEFSYSSFSEGEKQRIDMALMLTWRAVAKLKNSTNTNLLILDEVFDSSLDANGTEYLMNILHMLEDVNIFVISHKGDILQDKFRSIIKFEKVNNFSRIAKTA